MVHCFMTGVECRFEDAFVLNRRQARELLDTLKDRTASLRRVIDQLSPLDEQEPNEAVPAARRARFAPKKHRLVCKAVADALAPGFPEVSLFMTWPQYQAHSRQTVRQPAHRPPEEPAAATAMPDHENQHQP